MLNDRPDVAPETREAVLKVIRDLNFAPSRTLRAVPAGRTGLVGVTIPHFNGDYFTAILTGITDALDELDLQAVLCPTFHLQRHEAGLMDRLARGKTDGAILVLPSESSEELQRLKQSGFRFVIADDAYPLMGTSRSSPRRTWPERSRRPSTCLSWDTGGSV